jgi:hypothetical protein
MKQKISQGNHLLFRHNGNFTSTSLFQNISSVLVAPKMNASLSGSNVKTDEATTGIFTKNRIIQSVSKIHGITSGMGSSYVDNKNSLYQHRSANA